MNRQTKILVFSLVLILALVCVHAANSDFQASSSYSDIPLCLGSMFDDAITVTNTGIGLATFTITTDDEYAGWTTIVPAVLTLGPSERGVVHDLIRPPASIQPGSYRLNTHISSNTGLEKVLTQTITVSRCLNTGVDIQNYSFSNCPCTPTLYVFELTNTGDYTETYDLSVDTEQDYYTISPNPAILAPGQSTPVYIYINLPCDMYGDFTFDFVTYSRTSRFITKTPFYLNLRQSCYEFKMSPGRELQTHFNETVNLTITPVGSTAYSLCRGNLYLIPFEIDNDGEIGNIIDMSLEAPYFVTLSPGAVNVSRNANATAFLTVDALEAGEHNVSVIATSQRGLISKQLDMQLDITDCGGAGNVSLPVNVTGNITTNITENVTGQPQPATIAGILEITLYIVLAVIAALLILLLVLYFIRKHSKAAKKEPEVIEITEKERPAGEKKWFRGWLPWILILLALAIIGYFVFKWIFGWYFDWELGALYWTGGLFRTYWLCILIVLVVAALVILYFRYWTGIRKRFVTDKKEPKRKKPEKPAKKKPVWQFVIVISIGIVFLLMILCYFTGLCGNLGVYYPPQNATAAGNMTNATGTTQENITLEEPLVESPTAYIWNKNRVKTIDLLDFVNDTDNDLISFSATHVANITVNISDNGVVTFVPDKDWYGQRVITFIADDGHGGRTYSPDITLVVQNKESFPSWGFFTNLIDQYLYFFILLLVLAALVVIFLVLWIKGRAKGKKKIIVRRKKK